MIKNFDEKWISTDEVADHLGVKATTVREWIKKGSSIPTHKIGKFYKFKKSEIDEWINSGKSAELGDFWIWKNLIL